MKTRKTRVKNTTKYAKRQKGITLVALVITIIVLLILAGVGINMAISSDGLFAKAHEAVDKWNQSVAEEGNIYENLLLKANEINVGGNTGPTKPAEDRVGSVITETSEVAGVTKERKAPIPKGYTASQVEGENRIDKGLVIYQDGENGDSTPVTNETKASALTTRNQYVWIPVDDINDMIMCKSNTGSSICDIEIENGILKCKTHPIEEDTEEKWKEQIVGRLYTSTSQKVGDVYTYTMDFTKKDQTYDANSGYREPAIVTGNNEGTGNQYDGSTEPNYHGLENAGVFLGQLQKDFYAMAKSVDTYGGFYISRYEIGENGNSKKNQKVLIAASSNGSNYLGGNMWYGLYTASKKDGTTTSPNSHMIWGSQYDQVIKFIGTEAQIAHKGSNYQPTTTQLSGTTTPMKNICELEGNYWEWTAEAGGTALRVYRGGDYTRADNSNFHPASNHETYNPTGTHSLYSSRTSLYL